MSNLNFDSNDPKQLEELGKFLLNKAIAINILHRLKSIISVKNYESWYSGSIPKEIKFDLNSCYDFVRNLFDSKECIEVVAEVSKGNWLTKENYRCWINNTIYFTIGWGTLVKLDFNPERKICSISYYSARKNIRLKVFDNSKFVSFYVNDMDDDDIPLISSAKLLKNQELLSQKDYNKSLCDVIIPVSIDELLTRVQNLEYTTPAKHK